jgi:hypothetical protein
LPWLLRPLFAVFQVDAEINDAFALIFAARALMGILALAIVALTFGLAAAWRGPAAGWTAAALVASTFLFHDKTAETRPDVPATLLLATGWGLALATVSPRATRRGALAAASGACLGLAGLFTPKAAFALAAPAAVLLWHPSNDPRRVRLKGVALLGLGAVTPPLLALAFFTFQGAASSFLEGNVWINLRWRGRLGPSAVLLDLMRRTPLLLPLAAVGAWGAITSVRARRRDTAGTLLLAGLVGFVIGLLTVPVVYRQYVLLFVPLLAVLAAGGLLAACERLFRRRRDAAAAAVLLAVGSAGLWQIQRGSERDNTRTLDDIRFIHRNVAAWETVLDGFSGWAVFRPHAAYYFFLHGDLRAMIGDEEIAALERDLRSGHVAPKLILFDRYLRSVSPGITAFLEENYAPVGRERIRVRLYDNGRGRWDDTGVRRLGQTTPPADPLAGPHVVVAEGWRRVESEGEHVFRRCVGRCVLLVPVRAPRAFRAVVQARTGDGTAAAVELRVNGHAPRQGAVDGRWGASRFELPAAELRPGFNRFVLSCRRQEAPCTLAIATLELQPASEDPRAAESTARTSSSSTGRNSS